MSRKSLTEDGTLGKVTEAKADGSYKIQVISPGLGSSGWYSPQVLEAAAKAKVWPKGTHVYFDHPTATEDEERPARSVKDLAAVLTEDASWNGSALVAAIKPAGLGKTVLENDTFRSAVGVSVRASAEGEVGEVAGKRVWVVKEIFPDTFNSVDIVTHAGRGGVILESARKAQVEEAGELDSDRRDKFRNAVRDAHASEGVDVWVEDYDDTVVYWDRWGGEDPGTFSQTYTETDGAVELTGDPVQVRVKRTYVPIDGEPTAAAVAETTTPIVPVHPAGQSTTIKEHTMPEIEEGATVTVKETRMRQLEADAGRVPMLESELATEKARADKAETDLKIAEARDYAREFGSTRVKDANSELASPIVDKIVNEAMRDITLGEDGRLDTDAFGAKVDEARKAEETYLASIAENVGSVRGLGEAKDKKVVEAAVVTDTVSNVFGINRKGA
ncbi:hypothetical protein ACFPJ1_40660 [Kribbella qitaiheensis]|uniref:hypothetical protein n=1 Tax=Kribbella qitaiheensis TaxID=1544730 RepID=UPI00360DD3C3